MADHVRYTTLLPTIKCSNCNAELEISMMGDHACTGDAPEDDSSQTSDDWDRKESAAPHMSPAEQHEKQGQWLETSQPAVQEHEYLWPPNSKLPPIDATAANTFDMSREPLTPASMNSQAQCESPTTAQYRVPARSATAPIPRPPSPPSPEIPMSQDGAFPPFPFARQRTMSGTKSKSKPSLDGSAKLSPELPQGPMSPKMTGGPSILKRMNTMVRGPFGTKRHIGDAARDAQQHAHTHKRAESMGSVYTDDEPWPVSDQDLATLPSSPAAPDARSGLSRLDQHATRLPTGPAPPRPARPEAIDDFLQHLQEDGGPRSIGFQSRSSAPLNKSSPKDASPAEQSGPAALLEPSRPIEYRSSLTIMDGDSSFTSGQLSKSPEERDPSPLTTTQSRPANSSRSGSGAKQQSPEIPPLPTFSSADDYEVGNPYHSPSTSASSSATESKAESSRSSPPTSNGSNFSQNEKPFFSPIQEPELQHLPSLTYNRNAPPQLLQQSFQSHWSQSSSPSTGLRSPPANFSRPRAPEPIFIEPLSSKLLPTILPAMPESPVDPSLHMGLPPQIPSSSSSPRQMQLSPRSPKIPSGFTPSPALPRSPMHGGRAAQPSKAHCRGCTLTITGKSIKAADGRLTGRYHKECFMCQTCKEPFQTAEFYVIDNEPYCAHHYHVLNHSLCNSCDKGIEGQFLETQERQKFHPQCFRCEDCHKMLSQDYFEINGRTFCEADATRVHNKNNHLSPGRRFPERRTTKLMMM